MAVDPITRRHSDLESIDVSAEEIPEGLAALVLIHPKSLSDQMKTALVRYLASGGKVIAFLDPLENGSRRCITDDAITAKRPSIESKLVDARARRSDARRRGFGGSQLALSVSTPSGLNPSSSDIGPQ